MVGKVYYVANGPGISSAEQQIYIDALNAEGVNVIPDPKVKLKPAASKPNLNPASPDLKLYYYAAGQNVGYGALGLGYNRTVRLSRGLGIEVDGGMTKWQHKRPKQERCKY